MAKIDRETRYGIGFSLEMMDVEEARYFTERADAALYQVKGRGRDRAEVNLARSAPAEATAAPLPLKKSTGARLRRKSAPRKWSSSFWCLVLMLATPTDALTELFSD